MNNIVTINMHSIYKNIINTKKLNKNIIFVVKGNVYGYGYGFIRYINELVDSYAVSSIHEAKKLREHTIKNILILSPVLCEDIINDKNITYSISSMDQLKLYINSNIDNINIAIKVNTGLNRFGFNIKEIREALSLLCNLNYEIKDIYTHLATTTSDNDFNNVFIQYEVFKNCINIVENYIDINKVNIHFTDSAALLRLKKIDNLITSIRTGMFLLGLDPIPEVKNKIFTLEFPLSISTTVLDKHKLNDSMYYGYSKKAKHSMSICTIGIGYCDGMNKSWIGKYIMKNEYGMFKLLDISMNTSIIEIPEAIYSNIKILKTEFIIFSTQKELDNLANLANTSVEDIICGFYSLNNSIRYEEN